jgi:uncharacterized protein involved in exopolysaccharide biosynthesis
MNEILQLIQVIRRYTFSLAVIVISFGIAGVAVALLLPETYRAQAVMSPVESSAPGASSSIMSQLAGLPGIGSLGISAGTSSVEEHIAYLSSRSFAEDFIRDNGLLGIINKGEEFESPESAMWVAYKRFDLEIRHVFRDPATGLVSLAMDWTDPQLATEWANTYVAAVNRDLRQFALSKAERNIKFANEQLAKTTVVELQQAIYRLIEVEIRSAMLAQGQEEYAFRILDKALPPGERFRPRRSLIVVAFGIVGLFLGALFIVIAELYQLEKAARPSRPEK